MNKKTRNNIPSTFHLPRLLPTNGRAGRPPSTLGVSRGFALLYSVIVISLILTIAINISNTTFKQGILSGLAKDSQIAFYQADAGAECALYYDVALLAFPFGSTEQAIVGSYPTITCGAKTLTLDTIESRNDYFFYSDEQTPAGSPCFSIIFDKETDPAQNNVESRGHNMCGASIRRVERAVQVTY